MWESDSRQRKRRADHRANRRSEDVLALAGALRRQSELNKGLSGRPVQMTITDMSTTVECNDVGSEMSPNEAKLLDCFTDRAT